MKEWIVEEEEDDWDYGAIAYMVDGDEKTEIGWFGGEPEDNTHYRQYSWVIGALNEAYKLGVQDGIRKEYDRLADKV